MKNEQQKDCLSAPPLPVNNCKPVFFASKHHGLPLRLQRLVSPLEYCK